MPSPRRSGGLRELQQFDRDDDIDGKTTPPTPTILLTATAVPTINSDNAPSSATETEAPTPPWYVRTTDAPSPSPTDTDEFPVELRTTPPTPTALFSISEEPTRSPFHEYPTFYPTMEPTCANTTSRAGQIKCAAMSQFSQVQADWSTIDTVILSVALTVVFCTFFLYCLCCRQGKDNIDVDTSRVGKGHYTAVADQMLTPDSSPPSTPRSGGAGGGGGSGSGSGSRYGGVEVINPLTESSPLLSPPRERGRRAARSQVVNPPIPVRQPAKSLGDALGAREGLGGGGSVSAEAVRALPDDEDITSLL